MSAISCKRQLHRMRQLPVIPAQLRTCHTMVGLCVPSNKPYEPLLLLPVARCGLPTLSRMRVCSRPSSVSLLRRWAWAAPAPRLLLSAVLGNTCVTDGTAQHSKAQRVGTDQMLVSLQHMLGTDAPRDAHLQQDAPSGCHEGPPDGVGLAAAQVGAQLRDVVAHDLHMLQEQQQQQHPCVLGHMCPSVQPGTPEPMVLVAALGLLCTSQRRGLP